jgi:hypothetical protein
MARPAGRAIAVLPDEQPHTYRPQGRDRSMSNLGELIRIAQHKARSFSTECLVIAITTEAASLGGKLADFETARIARERGEPDGELAYGEAFTDLMATVLTMAAFTAELVNTRVDSWEFPTDIHPADIGLN